MIVNDQHMIVEPHLFRAKRVNNVAMSTKHITLNVTMSIKHITLNVTMSTKHITLNGTVSIKHITVNVIMPTKPITLKTTIQKRKSVPSHPKCPSLT